jgi:hypothetical protein
MPRTAATTTHRLHVQFTPAQEQRVLHWIQAHHLVIHDADPNDANMWSNQFHLLVKRVAHLPAPDVFFLRRNCRQASPDAHLEFAGYLNDLDTHSDVLAFMREVGMTVTIS